MPLTMEAESPPSQSGDQSSPEIIQIPPEVDQVSSSTKLDTSSEKCDLETTKAINLSDEDLNLTLHPFNISNCTVIEKHLDVNLEVGTSKSVSCEGSDSGVEIIENNEGSTFKRTLSSNSGVSNNFHDFDNVQSCDSSISYCSNYDEAFNILVRRNSSLFGDCILRNGDRTSENGSESSSVTGSSSSKNSKRNISVKKRVTTLEPKNKSNSPKERAKSKPPITPKTQSTSARLKSLDRIQGRTQNTQTARTNCLRSKQVPNNLEITKKEGSKRPSSARTPSTTRTPSATRTPLVTPTDDGRWPSVHSRPAPLMSKSMKGSIDSPQFKRNAMDTKTIEKYATLPRRRKEKSADELQKNRKTDREPSANRLSMPKKSVPRESLSMRVSTAGERKKKVKIYQEHSIQTSLTMDDINKAFSGQMVRPSSPEDKEYSEKSVQVDMRQNEVEALKQQLQEITEKHDVLLRNFKEQGVKLKEVEEKYKVEVLEKEGLQQELKHNTERVLTILGENNFNEEGSSDSLMVLETRFQNVSQIVLNQENEISRLNALCRSLQINLEQAMTSQRTLVQQQRELEMETIELQEFMQAEKTTLADALRESESEIKIT
ncbi:hypothetical protein HHI36_007527 [Cryptolaemus montrouzieri]|uniref:Uncharacterized protein n=1 Tax=Cryptolaemus montrouzieri TaxID=559131 RepID=A0ABD2MPW6_9CUCU